MNRVFSSADEALVYFTESNLATLSMLAERKKTSRSDLDRQLSICMGMLSNVNGDVAARMQLASFKVSRVLDMLKAAKQEPEGLSGALHRFVQNCK